MKASKRGGNATWHDGYVWGSGVWGFNFGYRLYYKLWVALCNRLNGSESQLSHLENAGDTLLTVSL